MLARRCVAVCLILWTLLLPVRAGAHSTSARVFSRVTTEERVLALTFDDGPHPRYTHAILDLLGQYGAKATFFVIGKNLLYYAEAAKRAVREGHEIGNHTYSHPTLAAFPQRK